MENQNLIIQLLIQNMKHEQLMKGLSRLGFHSEKYNMDLSGIVAELMGIPEIEMSWNWFYIYMDFLKKAGEYKTIDEGKNLLTLAETCYKQLTTCAQAEKENKKETSRAKS